MDATEADIVKAFEKYGDIEQIHIVKSGRGAIKFANLAFFAIQSAVAAVLDDKKVEVLGKVVSIGKRAKFYHDKRSVDLRTIHVYNFKPGTTREELHQHFEALGEKIETVKLIEPGVGIPPFGFVYFKKPASAKAAMSLHQSFLNGYNIKISYNHKKILTRQCYEDLTVVLMNNEELTGVDIKKLESVFAECGKIQYVDVIARKRILAFVTFETKEAATKALEMNGQTKEELELHLKPYAPFRNLTTIQVFNLDRRCTTEDLQLHFANAGRIVNIILRRRNAIIRFKDSDAFCKSFAYNESYIRGRVIFIEPLTKNKKVIFESANKRTKKRNRLPY